MIIYTDGRVFWTSKLYDEGEQRGQSGTPKQARARSFGCWRPRRRRCGGIGAKLTG